MNWSGLLILSALFLLVFAIGELMYHRFRVGADVTRKWSHVISGFLSLGFPVYLGELLSVAVICGAFLVLLSVSARLGFLRSINAVERKTFGSYLFPVAVFVSYGAYSWKGQVIYYYLPVLVLAISDMMAAMVGKRLPIYKPNGNKSLGGYLAFVLSAFCIVWGLTQLFFVPMHLPLLVAPFFWGIVEWISPSGTDNLSVPMVVIISLSIAGI